MDGPKSGACSPHSHPAPVTDRTLIRHCTIRAVIIAPPNKIQSPLAARAEGQGKTNPERSLGSPKASPQNTEPSRIMSAATNTSINVIAGDKEPCRDAMIASIPRPAIHQKTIPKKGQLRDRQNSGNIPRGTASLRSRPSMEHGRFSTAGAESRMSASSTNLVSRGVSASVVTGRLKCSGSCIFVGP